MVVPMVLGSRSALGVRGPKLQTSRVSNRTTAARSSSGSAFKVVRASQPDANGNAAPRLSDWPQKSDLFILRSDGMSCSRETVLGCGSLTFAHPSSQQHLLIWKNRPTCVMVLKKLGDELASEFVEVVRYLGEEQNMRVLVEPHEYKALSPLALPYVETYSEADIPELHSYVDFVTCLGGDGLILHASLLFKSAIPPIISFKLGSLGFLTCHEYRNFRQDLKDVIDGFQELETCRMTSSQDGSALQGVYITLRMRLLCTIYRKGRPSEEYEVLNEVVISRGANPFLTKIEVYEQDNLITKVQADGVMLATPTGSTAYNVAAGGSMVHPNVPAIMFTPICPHSLSFRPVILPDYAELEFRISEDARSPALVALDGKVFTDLDVGDSVFVRMSPNPVPTINDADGTTDWFKAIDRCFQWNQRLEQRKLVTQPGNGIQATSSKTEDATVEQKTTAVSAN